MFFPIMIDVEKLNIMVVGGGGIALRKVIKLIEFGGRPMVLSPNFCEGFDKIKMSVEIIKSEFDYSYLKDMDIVYLATDDKTLNEKISSFCMKNHILVNSLDNHRQSSFINMGFFKTKRSRFTLKNNEFKEIYGEAAEKIIKKNDVYSNEKFKNIKNERNFNNSVIDDKSKKAIKNDEDIIIAASTMGKNPRLLKFLVKKLKEETEIISKT